MEMMDWARALAALVVTLALIGLAALLARRLGMVQGLSLQALPKRIKVVERHMLDPRRQMVLVQVDETEHLLLLSPFGDRVLGAASAKAAEPDTP